MIPESKSGASANFATLAFKRDHSTTNLDPKLVSPLLDEGQNFQRVTLYRAIDLFSILLRLGDDPNVRLRLLPTLRVALLRFLV